jgi:hypothetical protein
VKANGVCHDLRTGRKGPKVTTVKDGMDTTLLVSENVHRDQTTWLSPLQATQMNGTADMTTNPEQRYGFMWIFDGNSPGPPDINNFQPFNRDTLNAAGNFTNATPKYRYARPASEHPDVFVVAFCGGSTRDINQNIEYRVYQQLMTSDGMKAEVPNSNPKVIIENTNQRFMNPPLNAGEY